MKATIAGRLESLIQNDPTVAPLARLQSEALHAATSFDWAEGIPDLVRSASGDTVPILHEQLLAVDVEQVRVLLTRLVRACQESDVAQVEPLAEALRGSRKHTSLLDSLDLLEASIAGDVNRLEQMAGETGVELGILGAVAQVAALPLLLACGSKASQLVKDGTWKEGYCPVCAAWPALSELKGLERRRWLRCGRCSTAWAFRNQRCAFCSNDDHRSLTYLAPEGEHESRHVMACDSCGGYLKAFATVRSFGSDEIGWKDLTSLELDIAALERGYGRPVRLGFPLRVTLVPLERRNGWLPWRR